MYVQKKVDNFFINRYLLKIDDKKKLIVCILFKKIQRNQISIHLYLYIFLRVNKGM